jgi:SNF2 family DNA or RNA helicase
MAASGAGSVIDIISDGTASESDEVHEVLGNRKAQKRKLDRGFSEKVHLTDDSDNAPTVPKKRRAKRKSTTKGKKRVKARGEDGGEPSDQDDDQLSTIPEYLQARRRDFDARRRQYHDSALMLPPDYSGITFGQADGLRDVEERPTFSSQSGVKPCRPYRDIELPQSAGLIPASIARYLRDYQVTGIAFLHKKFVYQEGGILGDDMGLGKTVQVAAFLAAAFGKSGDERDAKRMREMRYYNDRWYPRILIVCPGSLIMNWRNELNRWGWWHIDIFHGSNKEDILGTARAGLLEVMITTYDTYKNCSSSVNMVQWDAVIVDECHRLKDRYSATTKAMMEVNALCRIGLTGTAIQNRYEELWTLLDWTNPGHFGTIAEWKTTVSKPLTIGQSHDANMAQLSLARQTARKLVENLLPRYFLRRMKTLIAHQLPKKTDRVVFCPLTDLQREAYENFIESGDIELLRTLSEPCEHGKKRGWCCYKTVPSGASWQSIIFPSMVTLQKLANHLTLLVPNTTDTDTKHKSELRNLQMCVPDIWQELYSQRDQIRSLVNPEFCGKWKILKKLLKFWSSRNDKVLVFSHSVRLLRILQHLFSSTSYTVSYLDGSLSYEARQDVVDNFNTDPHQFVFLISTKAGGVGLNITSANKVVIVDPHWNPAYDLQAQDRAYRIGQTRDVEVFRLISLGTVEEVVYARQIYKQQQANIGYTASSERRYFKGVQEDTERKGEIFGLANIFTYHPDSGLLRDIVNKTNIAEAKAGVSLTDINMQNALDDDDLGAVKKEETDAEDGGLSQLADLLKAKDQEQELESRKAADPRTDAVQAILASAGVEYTHDNSEVVGTSKVEETLSRQAVERAYEENDAQGLGALFAESSDEIGDEGVHATYKPPEEVRLRQFCSMAQEFGFVNATEFALVVESWTQEARRNCLDTFYRRRAAKLATTTGDDPAKEERDGHGHRKEKKEELDETKVAIAKMEPADPRTPLKKEPKVEATNHETKGEREPSPLVNIKIEKKLTLKTEGTSKRNSIFLSDDDEDDEL